MLVVVVWHLTLCWVVLVPMSKLTETAVEWPLALSRWSLAAVLPDGGLLRGSTTRALGPDGVHEGPL